MTWWHSIKSKKPTSRVKAVERLAETISDETMSQLLEAFKDEDWRVRCAALKVLEKMAKAVKPGGWLLVEEPDFNIEAIAPETDEHLKRLWTRGMRAVGLVQRQRGMDVTLGQRLFGMVRSLGFTSMASEGQTCMFQGGSPAGEAYRLTMEQLSDPCVATGEISAQEFAAFLALFSDPSCVMRQFLLMSVWGRRPTV